MPEIECAENSISMLKRHCRMFLFACKGSPEIMFNEVAESFFQFGLLHLISTMFLIKDKERDKSFGAFHRILDSMGKSFLLNDIDKTLNTSIGETTLGDYIRKKRNKLATHNDLSVNNLPKENNAVSFNDDSIKQFNDAMTTLEQNVSVLLNRLSELEL